MKVDPFYRRAGSFIFSLIRQREYLLLTGQSKKDPVILMQDLRFLKLHLGQNGYRTDPQMARFWLYHHEKILHLLPGVGAPTHDSLVISFLEFTHEALSLHLQSLIPTPPISKNFPTIHP